MPSRHASPAGGRSAARLEPPGEDAPAPLARRARSQLVRLATGLLCCSAAACSGSEDDTAPARPNILLVSIDSLRPDHLGCYGYERDTSPVLDELAARGVRFDQAVSPTSWTLPAHATLFTGLPPEGHGLRVDATALSDEAVTLAEVLADAGYATAAFVGGPFLRTMYGMDQGFEVYDESVVKEFRASQKGATSPRLVGLTTDWLDDWERRDEPAPFFVFLHLWDVHYDYAPPPPYDSLFDPDYEGSVTGDDFETGNQVRLGMDPRDLEHVVALYDGEIAYTVHHLGTLLDHLEARGLADDTLVVVTSDHGEEFFEHGAKGHRKNLFDPSLRVPLIMSWPGRLPEGRVVESQVRLQDLPLTLLAQAGVAPPVGFAFAGPGAPQDLTPLMASDAGRGPDLEAFGDLQGVLTTLRGEGVKLVRTTDRGGVVEHELYLLDEDGESLAADDDSGPRLAELRQRMLEWKQRWARRRPLSVEIELSDEQTEHLRALGYLR
jgi:arylsulfatase A-like enzyme